MYKCAIIGVGGPRAGGLAAGQGLFARAEQLCVIAKRGEDRRAIDRVSEVDLDAFVGAAFFSG